MSIALIAFLFFWNGARDSCPATTRKNSEGPSGTLEKMIVANGVVTMNLDLKGLGVEKPRESLRLTVAPNSFFTVLVFNNELRGPLPSSMTVTPEDGKKIGAPFNLSSNEFVIEERPCDEAFDLVVRDSKRSVVFFNIDRQQYSYEPSKHLLRIDNGRLLMSESLAKQLGRASDASNEVGTISIEVTLYPIEITELVNGNATAAVLPSTQNGGHSPAVGTEPGPDVIVGDLPSTVQAGDDGGTPPTQVGLAIGTTSCNNGREPVHWFATPSNDHPVIPQNLYRMSGGGDHTERFEQIGQSWVKYAFEALETNTCNFGCNTNGCITGSNLCSGCSNPESVSSNAVQNSLGSRGWINPFTGFFPQNPNPNNHTGHIHNGTSHRVLVNASDLNTTLNVGASYFAEGQYIAPSEYNWCQSNPGQCNMYNNVSYRQFAVSGMTNFTFSAVAPTAQMQPAINAWTNATFQTVQPAPGIDGIAILGYKVSNPSAGVWHYEYAVYNENLDRAIQLFSVPLGDGVTVSNIGFHAPPQHPGFANDGTCENQGYSSQPWDSNQTTNAITWQCETLVQNCNANAVRWGTLYNFRFDSNKPPTNTNAMIGFFKTGSPITVPIQAPMPNLQLTSIVSRKTHGLAGTFDVDLPLTGTLGVECRSTGGNHTFVFMFTNNVVSGNAAVTSGTGTISGTPVFAGDMMTVNLSGVADAQQIAVTISDVMDTFGQTLPDRSVNAVILAGDTNGNRVVNAADVAETKAQQGAVIDLTNFRNDVNANGTINAADTALVKGNAGNSVP
jgi:hypothetical protein